MWQSLGVATGSIGRCVDVVVGDMDPMYLILSDWFSWLIVEYKLDQLRITGKGS